MTPDERKYTLIFLAQAKNANNPAWDVAINFIIKALAKLEELEDETGRCSCEEVKVTTAMPSYKCTQCGKVKRRAPSTI